MVRSDSLRTLPRRAAEWASTPAGLAWLFVIGFAIRLWLARGPGFKIDMGTFSYWADRLATVGPSHFYDDPELFADYPPGYLYVLWGVGKLSRALTGGAPSDFLLKLPAILLDLVLAGVVVRLATRLTPSSFRGFPWRGVAAAAILVNPAVFFVSAVWGQVDVALGVIVLSAFLLLGTGPPSMMREASGLALLVLAIAAKPQALFVVPVAVLLLVWRHVRGESSQRGPMGVGAGLARVGGLGVFSLGVALVIMWPFRLGPLRVWEFYRQASGTYKHTSVWAFNFWGLAGFWRPDSGPEAFEVFGVPAFAVGLALFVAGSALVLVQAWRRLNAGESEGRVLLFGGAAASMIAFCVLTRIHERYLFFSLVALAPLAAYRGFRRALAVLSVLFFVNVYYPYVYYTYFYEQSRNRPYRFGSLFEGIYGSPGATDAVQLKVLSVVTALFCLFVAVAGWGWLRSRSGAELPPDSETAEEAVADGEAVTPEPRRDWTLTLHPVGARGMAVAVLVVLIALATRLPGLASPPGMYFDEVYHARTAGEYLEKRAVYEYTHPPLAKELIALSTKTVSGFEVREGPRPRRAASGMVAAGDGDVAAWVARGEGQLRLRTGSVTGDCTLRASRSFPVAFEPTVVGVSDVLTTVGGAAEQGPVAAGFSSAGQVWSVPMAFLPVAVANLGGTSFVVTQDGSLSTVSFEGQLEVRAQGASAVSADPRNSVVWVSFPDDKRVASFTQDGVQKESVAVSGAPGPLVAPDGSNRVLAADAGAPAIESVDTEAKNRTAEFTRGSADRLVTIPDTGLAWASEGTRVRVIEPLGLAQIGSVRLPGFPVALVADRDDNQVAAVLPDGSLACVRGSPTFGWRFGSALFGSLMVGLAFLIALRCFGNPRLAALAALFLAVCGLAFTMARISMIDSFVAAFIAAAWFAALSSLYHWGARSSGARSRAATLGWVAACGLMLGMAIASKWVGVYTFAGIGALYLWDLAVRRKDSIISVAGHPAASLAAAAVLLVAIPAGVYVATYIPYFSLGNSWQQFTALQASMYDYHAHLTATHDFGSPWYGWPFGHKAVYLWVNSPGQPHAEMWTTANPVVFLGGLVAMVAAAVAAVRTRSVALAAIPVAALAQILPWTLVSRVAFLYHYLAIVPFLCIALAWWLIRAPGDERRRRIRVTAVAVAAVVAFLLILPILDGWTVGDGYISAVKRATEGISFAPVWLLQNTVGALLG
ncbi:MAG TPA: phospholipid carrier-dependent glycosyltransferase [Actinomycetota bacterium]|nr:phospholipid carrier-dependent glycosyltransferase [Actinomycetota bacterium]